jgi:hypothetical protein
VRARDRSVLPVLSTLPLAFTTSMVLACATLIGAGASMTVPFASRQALGAYQSVPSGARVNAHGENVAPGGATTQRPGDHAQRERRQVHSPSTQTAPAGITGIVSTRPGGGGKSTAVSALVVCGVYVGCGSDRAHAVATHAPTRRNGATRDRGAPRVKESGTIRIRCERDWSTTIGGRRA